jgi:hypothetical protein
MPQLKRARGLILHGRVLFHYVGRLSKKVYGKDDFSQSHGPKKLPRSAFKTIRKPLSNPSSCRNGRTSETEAKTPNGQRNAHNFKTTDIMNRIFNLQIPFHNNNKHQNKQPLRRLLSPQPSFADESLYKEDDIMIFPAISLLPTTKQDLAPTPLVRTKSCDSFSTITTTEAAPGESSCCGIKKMPVRLSSSVLANALLPLEISFPNKPLPPMPRQLMEKARPIPELEIMEEDDDYFEDDDDDDGDYEIVFLPDDHLPPPPPPSAKMTATVPPPLHTYSRKMESDPQPEEPCQNRPALRRGPSVGLQQDLCVPARSFEPGIRTLPSSAGQVLQQRDLCIPARSSFFQPELMGGTRFEI